jgi:hypothetical protein
MKVKFYHKNGECIGDIIKIEAARKMVVVKSSQSVDYVYPEQLIKIVKKTRPEFMFSYHADGVWRGIVHNKSEVEVLKTSGCEVWLMRGVKKL